MKIYVSQPSFQAAMIQVRYARCTAQQNCHPSLREEIYSTIGITEILGE